MELQALGSVCWKSCYTFSLNMTSMLIEHSTTDSSLLRLQRCCATEYDDFKEMLLMFRSLHYEKPT
jgi:hypothetical protein